MKKLMVSLVIVALLGTAVFFTVTGADEAGYTFDIANPYRTEAALERTPLTMEAEIYFPLDTPKSTEGGAILSNYRYDTERCTSYEITANGNPRLFWINENGEMYSFSFGDVSVYMGEWLHLTITVDPREQRARCYVDGMLRQTLVCSGISASATDWQYGIGSVMRSGNAKYFKGSIRSLKAYSDVRTDAEVMRDVEKHDDSNLMLYYDFSDISAGTYPEIISDKSACSMDAKLDSFWIGGDVESDFEYAYSFAVVGDTQHVNHHHPAEFHKIYDYILNNIESKKIKMVMGLGDIVDQNYDREWVMAKEQISRLNGVVPYSLVRGNHDWTSNFKANFMNDGYLSGLDGMYSDELENTWQELIVGEVKYLIFTLDFGARDTVLEWASDVIAAHPEHNVIITTHGYMYGNGNFVNIPVGDGGLAYKIGTPNGGEGMWDKLISQHENIVLVLCGHIESDRVFVKQSEGKNGHIVTQMLIDAQEVDRVNRVTGNVAMFYFSEDGSKLRVEYYSTIQESYFGYSNQFELELDVVKPSLLD